MSNAFTMAASIVGMVLGTAGFAVSLMNYLRDRPHVKLKLIWDMTELGTGKLFGLVKVSNIGRRDVFISAVALELPAGYKHSHLLLNDAVVGSKLSEGDRPITYQISYEQLAQYSKDWRKLRAYAEDSTGRKYFSDYPHKASKTPGWAV